MRVTLLAPILTIVTLGSAAAQDQPYVEPLRPLVNVSLAYGLVVMQTIEDGPSNSRWDFGRVYQYRLTLDTPVGFDTKLGVTLGYAPVDMHYSVLSQTRPTTSQCPRRCQVNADLFTYGATLRVETGARLIHLLEINAMVNQFGNFRDNRTDVQLPPVGGDRDLMFSAGYGIGWAPTRRFQVNLLGDVGITVHNRAGVDSDINRVNQMILIRSVFRAAIGG
jgi:hypothetical protein